MSNAYIYHHNDDDGYCSGAIIYKYLTQSIYDQIHIQKINYTKILDLSEIKSDDEVYFVDYSFSNEANINSLKELVKRMDTGTVYWYDHHKSSWEILSKWVEESDPIMTSKNFQHSIDTRYCGAMICYQNCLRKINSTNEYCEDNAPEFIKYIDSHDTWKHNMPNTEEFHIGMMFKNNNITRYFDEIITETGDIFNWEVDLTRKFVLDCIAKGKAIKPYQKIQNKKIARSLGYPFRFTTMDFRYPIINETNIVSKDYNCFAINGFGNSTIFGDLINKYDFVALFNYDGEQYTYSIYSVKEEIDCSEIAKRIGEETGLGGGGHKGAAGFQSKEQLFHKNEAYVSKKKIYPDDYKDEYRVKLFEGSVQDASYFIRDIQNDKRIKALMDEKRFYGEATSISRSELLSMNHSSRIFEVSPTDMCFRIESVDNNIEIDDTKASVYGTIKPVTYTINGRLLQEALENGDEVKFHPRYFTGGLIPRLITVDRII